jgi:hypothetical protein
VIEHLWIFVEIKMKILMNCKPDCSAAMCDFDIKVKPHKIVFSKWVSGNQLSKESKQL